MDASTHGNPGRIAALGVVAAAVACVAVLRPVVEAFGYSQVNWAVIAYVAAPLVLLFGTGVRRYGVLLAAVLAVVITAAATATAAALFVLALGMSLSGSPNSGLFLALLWMGPPLVVVLLGGAALRFIRPRVQAGG